MAVILMTFLLLLLIVTAMSIGVLMGRRPITGSCGGVGAALGEKDYVCDLCGGDPAKCENSQERQGDGGGRAADRSADLAYNADKQ